MPHRSRPPALVAAATLVLAAVGVASTATARTICVSTSAELRQALANVSDGGPYVNEAVTIKLVAGTYLTEGTAFTSQALTTTAELDVNGSYMPGCSLPAKSYTATILDAQGTSGVLAITRPSGLVAMQRFVARNGNADVGAGIRVNYGVTPTAIVAMNWIAVLNNHASGDGGGVYLAGAAPVNYGPIQINTSLFAGNSAGGEGGAGYLRIGGGGDGRLGFDTLAANTAGTGGTGGFYAVGDQGNYSYLGMVAWGNTPASLYFGRPATVDWSDYDALAAGSLAPVANHVIALDPKFVDPAAGDFHLGPGTPLTRYCPCHAYTPTDLENHPYPPTTTGAEIGVYVDTIFLDHNDG